MVVVAAKRFYVKTRSQCEFVSSMSMSATNFRRDPTYLKCINIVYEKPMDELNDKFHVENFGGLPCCMKEMALLRKWPY